MDLNFALENLPRLLKATVLTIELTLLSLFFYSFAAVLYLLLTFISMKLINKLEVKYSRGYWWILN